jgi:hypothetical protein
MHFPEKAPASKNQRFGGLNKRLLSLAAKTWGNRSKSGRYIENGSVSFF